eukprot:15375470-Alexandrium_andersonii.AAC.1
MRYVGTEGGQATSQRLEVLCGLASMCAAAPASLPYIARDSLALCAVSVAALAGRARDDNPDQFEHFDASALGMLALLAVVGMFHLDRCSGGARKALDACSSRVFVYEPGAYAPIGFWDPADFSADCPSL